MCIATKLFALGLTIFFIYLPLNSFGVIPWSIPYGSFGGPFLLIVYGLFMMLLGVPGVAEGSFASDGKQLRMKSSYKLIVRFLFGPIIIFMALIAWNIGNLGSMFPFLYDSSFGVIGNLNGLGDSIVLIVSIFYLFIVVSRFGKDSL